VGDGFPVRSLFSYDRFGQSISPFLLLDYAGPAEFSPAPPRARGVGEHPHRGFETVTIVYQGEVAHRDSTGNSGVIGPGDVQWMTAASGILHDEFHSPGFTKRGGTLEMVQLWVNLPAKHKMSAPRYQTLLRRDIPRVELPQAAGSVRVIAGSCGEAHGPASTFSPLNVWDLQLEAAGTAGCSRRGNQLARRGSQLGAALEWGAHSRTDCRLWSVRDEFAAGNRTGHARLSSRQIRPHAIRAEVHCRRLTASGGSAAAA
jgi:redox-sensitive bicupin YhaK (pirin superfamily)